MALRFARLLVLPQAPKFGALLAVAKEAVHQKRLTRSNAGELFLVVKR